MMKTMFAIMTLIPALVAGNATAGTWDCWSFQHGTLYDKDGTLPADYYSSRGESVFDWYAPEQYRPLYEVFSREGYVCFDISDQTGRIIGMQWDVAFETTGSLRLESSREYAEVLYRTNPLDWAGYAAEFIFDGDLKMYPMMWEFYNNGAWRRKVAVEYTKDVGDGPVEVREILEMYR
jgi:hypothetical protein